MRKLLCVTAAVFAFGASAANAATVTLVGAAGISAFQVTTANIQGNIIGTSALAYLSDYIEFQVAPTTFTTISVNDLGGVYPDEYFRIAENTAGGAVVLAPQLVSNTAFGTTVTLVLASGINYFLELLSNPPSVGNSSQGVTVVASDDRPAPTPLPGGLALLAGGLGLLGFAGFKKRRKAGSDLGRLVTSNVS